MTELGPTARDEVLRAWCERDRACSLVPEDHRFIEDSSALRALIVELAAGRGPAGEDLPVDDLYDACGVIGRMIAQSGGSPTLASALIDHASETIDARGAAWIAPARAAVAEGFAAALVEGVERRALEAWEYPRCAVSLDAGAIAVTASYPCEDPEAIAEWAARVAKAIALGGARRAFVSGDARGALVDALAFVGVLVV
ncbi:MAG: hypothetical protein ACREJ3_16630 [Polyangiaceae bacterium]